MAADGLGRDLLGIWQTPPYLHDGSAATLRDVLTTRNVDDTHGEVSSLSDEEIDELVAYMMQIDSGEAPRRLPFEMSEAGGPDAGTSGETGDAGTPGEMRASGGSGCKLDPGPERSPAFAWFVALLSLLGARRSSRTRRGRRPAST
jgi:hypothetical protein